jgi:putative ABC transport system permease protein
MSGSRRILSRLRSFLRNSRADEELAREVASHLSLLADDFERRGMSPEEARLAAKRAYGGVEQAKQAHRDERTLLWLERTGQDLRYAVRTLAKSPGFAAVTILTLALGIGATTAIFSVVYGVLISPYPYAHPEKIWVPGLQNAENQQIMRPFSRDEFKAMAALPAFSDMMATTPSRMLLSGEFPAQNITAPQLTANAFGFLGVPPVLGRTFGPGDFSASGEPQPVTVITFKLWQQLFGEDPKALGRTLRLDERLYTIIGVMPSRFGWWTSDGLWLPMASTAGDHGRAFPIGRLAPGVDPSVARQQLQSVEAGLAKAYPADFPKKSFAATLTNYLDLTVASGEMQQALQLLFGAVVFLLLIACANIANLQLARATGRTREMAVRLAIGAGRGRLVRQLLTESVLLSGLGGALGLAFAVAITRLMVVLMPGFNVPNEARIEVNGYVLLFCVAVSLVTGILFGLVPALQATRPDLTGSLKDERSAACSVRGGAFRSTLVVVEMALSVVLLISAGLTIRSFLALQNVDPGFRPENVVMAEVDLPQSRYTTLEQRNRFAQEFLERVEVIPGVQAAEIGNGGTPDDGPPTGYAINGQPGPDSKPIILNQVSADYLKTLGIALRRGRMLGPDDIKRGDRIAVINESAAKLWPAGEDPIGQRIHLDFFTKPARRVIFPDNPSPDFIIVGICADTHNDGLTSATLPAVFVPFTVAAPTWRTLVIRSGADAGVIINSMRTAVAGMDPLLPVSNTRTMQQSIAEQSAQPKFTMALFTFFAAVGLALATVGLFSVLSFLVSRRTREIGVRMALGAQRGDVMRLVLKDGGRLAGLGILLGTIASVGAARVVRSQVDLFQINSIDPVSFGAVILLLSMVALFASLLPARRAAKVDPMVSLRHE